MITSLCRTNAKACEYSKRDQILFVHSFAVFDPEILTFSFSSEHKTTYKNPNSSSLSNSLQSQENLVTLTISWHNMTTSRREPTACAWIRADVCRQDGATCSKNACIKIVPYHRYARNLTLTVSVHDCMAHCSKAFAS